MGAKRKFKILALDGGGIRGVITARILKEIEAQVQKPLNQYFDLIAGTSTGSIVAAGLVTGMSPDQLIGIYQKEGGKIFQPSWQRNLMKWLRGPKYSNQGLIEVLQSHLQHKEFGEIQFGHLSQLSQAKLLILAYDTLFRNTTFFVSHLPEAQQRWYYDAKLWEVCASSAAAPTFFPPYEFKWREDPKNADGDEWKFPHVDGGVAANDPALAALGHVLGIEKQKLEDIAILSVGTGKTTEPLEYKQVQNWGMLSWASHIPDVFMGGQLQISADLCDQILTSGNPDGYLRLQFELNRRFDRKTPSCFPKCLPKEKQVNCYTGNKVSEAMDNASPENIQQLLDTTEAFLNGTDYSRANGKSLSVKEAIAHFLETNA